MVESEAMSSPAHAYLPPDAAADFALRKVTKRYNGVKALDQVSLSFAADSTTALIGGSGAGKYCRPITGWMASGAGSHA